MKKKTWAAVIAGTLFLCAAAVTAGSYAKRKLIEEAAAGSSPAAGAAGGIYPDTYDGRGSMGLLRRYENNIRRDGRRGH